VQSQYRAPEYDDDPLHSKGVIVVRLATIYTPPIPKTAARCRLRAAVFGAVQISVCRTGG
ncbi:MAG: hypothetical protein WAX14_03135, partial [Rhodococcus sp. (in: high G+C Gram-positive bacteria)]|uniref:hypothetical protein n=1 Tax=Rhodococcus sp. TaxID=1831 RepID=UPI003BB5F868